MGDVFVSEQQKRALVFVDCRRLDRNQVKGTIPSTVGQLSSLTHL
jgi:hypothetical protein